MSLKDVKPGHSLRLFILDPTGDILRLEADLDMVSEIDHRYHTASMNWFTHHQDKARLDLSVLDFER